MPVFAGLVRLGFWQLDRATQKRTRHAEYVARQAQPAADLALFAGADEERLRWRSVRAEGRYAGPTFLHDNRPHRGRNGFEVFTPFVVAGGRTVLVNRGWVPAPPERSRYPAIDTPDEPVTVLGHAGPPPVTGIRLNAAAGAVERLAPGIVRIQTVDYDVLSPIVGRALERYVVYLGADAAAGFTRDWPPPGDGAAKHRAYAVQWFAMATVFGVAVLLAVRQRRRDAHSPR